MHEVTCLFYFFSLPKVSNFCNKNFALLYPSSSPAINHVLRYKKKKKPSLLFSPSRSPPFGICPVSFIITAIKLSSLVTVCDSHTHTLSLSLFLSFIFFFFFLFLLDLGEEFSIRHENCPLAVNNDDSGSREQEKEN